MADIGSYLDRLTKKQLIIAVGALALDKGVDLATGGALNKMTKKALVALGRGLLPIAGRAGVSIGGTALGMGRLAMTNPYIAGATILYVGYKERDRIRTLLEQGYEFVEEAIPGGIPTPTAQPRPVPELPFFPPLIRTRTPTQFNKAVKKGMAVVKASTTYGKKGTMSAPKKALALVSKVVSGIKKKKKAPKSGIRRKVYLAAKKFKLI